MKRVLLLSLLVWSASAAPARWIGWTIPVREMYFGDNECHERRETHRALVAVKMSGDRVEEVRIRDGECPAGDVELLAKTPEESVAWLAEHVTDRKVITAIALHDTPSVVPVLQRFVGNEYDREIRRQAIFWLGQRAGEKVAGELRRLADDDPDDEIREQAVFAISQLPRERSVPLLIDLVKTHKSARVRKRAMFWLAQTDDPRAITLIEEILAR